MGNTWHTINAIYQLSLRSFQDSNNDGIGDIPGLISRLWYLKGTDDSLGVDALMLTPCYPSPQKDFGYDVTDFMAIAPEYGTMEDIETCIKRAHMHDIKVMFDLIINHTSDQHDWFKESRRSRDNPKRDWYVWRDPSPDGGPPNNWCSKFGGSIWEYDDHTNQYFLHTFLKEQPDLNWQNPAVREAMREVMRFWLDKGVDGFRVDAAIYIAKDWTFADNPANPNFVAGDKDELRFLDANISYGDDLIPYLQELIDILNAYDDKRMTFEAYPEGKQIGIDRYALFETLHSDSVSPMIVEATWTDPSSPAFSELMNDVKKYLKKDTSLPMVPLGNHDRSRLATRYGDEGARAAAEVQLRLKGVIPIIYYSDEIGMTDVDVPVEKQTDFAQQIWVGCRDPFRTPMHWDGSAFGGFSLHNPWLPVGNVSRNVKQQRLDENSLFTMYQRLLQERTLCMNEQQKKAWRGVRSMYQIYPRSFKDTNGDGIGDIPGVTEKLDYVKTVADAIWLSPIYTSPQKDFGYDISSFVDIAPEFGTLADFDRLITEAHSCELKVMMDITPNHTSDQHDWFKESRASRDNPKRDWYIWRDKPNNWVSLAGGPSWTLDEQTGQYYLHSWMSNQPDLNWQNPEVRSAMHDVMRFWYDRGVDGFRVDAIWVLAKDEQLADDVLIDGKSGEAYGDYQHLYCRNGSRLHEYLDGMARVAGEYDDRLLIFEYYPTPEFGDALQQVYGLHAIQPAYATVFFFDGMQWQLDAATFGKGIANYLQHLPESATPVITFGNHDQMRILTRFGGEAQARLIAFLQLTLPGIPCVYYGEEIGMKDGYIPVGAGKDGFGSDGMMAGRDPERTPMQWDASLQAGFTTNSDPWLPVADEYMTKNVSQEESEATSFLSLYRTLVSFRRTYSVLCDGTFTLLGYNNNILAYEVHDDNQRFRVLINFADKEQPIAPTSSVMYSSLRASTSEQYEKLLPFEAILIDATEE